VVEFWLDLVLFEYVYLIGEVELKIFEDEFLFKDFIEFSFFILLFDEVLFNNIKFSCICLVFTLSLLFYLL
jgi:hypothetical protein